MSQWTHPICERCYRREYGRDPARMTTPVEERCCYCDEQTSDGIYVRENPAEVEFHREHVDA